MAQQTTSLASGLLVVIGLVLAVVGSSRASHNPPLSEEQAINRAVHRTRSADGKAMYSITDAEIHQAMQDMELNNLAREQESRNGKVLMSAGVLLLAIGGVAFALSRASDARSNPEPPV